jgi:hypothetical protein
MVLTELNKGIGNRKREFNNEERKKEVNSRTSNREVPSLKFPAEFCSGFWNRETSRALET